MTIPRTPPQYQGTDEAIRRWSASLVQFLNSTFLNLYEIAERHPIVKTYTITASGTTLVGNIDFTPSCIMVLADDAALDSASHGIDDGTTHSCIYTFLNGSNVSQQASSDSYSAYLTNNAGTSTLGVYISSKTTDGLTLTSVVAGTISASVKVLVFP